MTGPRALGRRGAHWYETAARGASNWVEPLRRLRVEEADGGGGHADGTPREMALLGQGQQEILYLRGVGPAGVDEQGRLRSRVSREGTLRSGSFNASYRPSRCA